MDNYLKTKSRQNFIMNYLVTTLALILFITAMTNADKTSDGCVCVSTNLGCDGLSKRTQKMVQTGWCNLRCCKEPMIGEKRECKCLHAPSCPEEYPDESGDCSHLISCCPDRSMKKHDL